MNEVKPSVNSTNPAIDDRPLGQRLSELLSHLRRTTSELHSELRKCLASESGLEFIRPSQAHLRRNQQLDKAYDLCRQAEDRWELLAYHFGKSSGFCL
jgi:hypothetical protein